MQPQSLSSSPGLVSLSFSSKSERSLLWSLNPPLCDSSVAKLTQHFFFYLFIFVEKTLSMLHQLMKHTCRVHLTGRNVWIMYCFVNSDGAPCVRLLVCPREREIQTLHVPLRLTAWKSFDEWDIGRRTASEYWPVAGFVLAVRSLFEWCSCTLLIIHKIARVGGGHRVKAIIKMRGAANLCKSAMDGWLNRPLGLLSHQVMTQFLKSKNYIGQQSTKSYSTFLFWWPGFMRHYCTAY